MVDAVTLEGILTRITQQQQEQQQQFAQYIVDRQKQQQVEYAENLQQILEKVGKENSFGKPRNKESLTSKRAFTMLANYTGKPEEYDTWRFQLVQFLSQDPAFPAMLEWIETELGDENSHVEEIEAKEEKNKQEVAEEHEGAISAEELERKKVHEEKKPQSYRWYNEQLYQALALNCKGDALAMIKNLASTEHEKTRGVTAWHRLTKDHRGSNTQRILGLVGRVFQPPRILKYLDLTGAIEMWETRIREYERLVKQTEGEACKVPQSCKVFIVRNMVPKEMEKDLLKIHPTASYAKTKEYIMEQVNLKRHCHFEDRETGKDKDKDKPVPMEVDALLAKFYELKTDAEGGAGVEKGVVENSEEQESTREKGTAMEEIEKELLALKGGWKGGKGKGKGRKFDGYCDHCGGYGHRLNQCFIKDEEVRREMEKGGGKKGGGWGDWKGGAGGKGQGNWGSWKGGVGGKGAGFQGNQWGGKGGFGGKGGKKGGGKVCIGLTVKEEGVLRSGLWEEFPSCSSCQQA